LKQIKKGRAILDPALKLINYNLPSFVLSLFFFRFSLRLLSRLLDLARILLSLLPDLSLGLCSWLLNLLLKLLPLLLNLPKRLLALLLNFA
jgi:hypothetical protein